MRQTRGSCAASANNQVHNIYEHQLALEDMDIPRDGSRSRRTSAPTAHGHDCGYHVPTTGHERCDGPLEANMDTKLSERDFARALSEVLNRVRDGERFVVERDGERLAILTPPAAGPALGISGSELVARIGDLKMPGDGFADDIEAARARLRPASVHSWHD